MRKADIQVLRQIPLMQQQMNAATQQATDYGDALRRKYPDLRLKRFAVVAVGFERHLPVKNHTDSRNRVLLKSLDYTCR